MYLSQICKIINAGPPVDVNPASLDCVYVNMENYSHITMIFQMGVGAAPTITIEKSATGSGAGTAIAFSYRLCNTAYNATNGDLLAAAVLIVGAGGVALGATDNSYMVVELDADVIGTTYPYVRAVATTGGAGLFACIYVLSGARYKEPGTALTV